MLDDTCTSSHSGGGDTAHIPPGVPKSASKHWNMGSCAECGHPFARKLRGWARLYCSGACQASARRHRNPAKARAKCRRWWDANKDKRNARRRAAAAVDRDALVAIKAARRGKLIQSVGGSVKMDALAMAISRAHALPYTPTSVRVATEEDRPHRMRVPYRDIEVDVVSLGELGLFTTTKDAARALRVSPSLVRLWCRRESGFAIQPTGKAGTYYIPIHKIGMGHDTVAQARPTQKHHTISFNQKTKVEIIKAEVARRYLVSPSEVISAQRAARFIRARHISQYLSCRLTTLSLPQLGKIFVRDHTTILHARDSIAAKRANDAELDAEISAIELVLHAKFAEVAAARIGAAA